MAEPSMMSWTFVSECAVPSDVDQMLVGGETAVAAYKTIRDVAVITNKRLIMRDLLPALEIRRHVVERERGACGLQRRA